MPLVVWYEFGDYRYSPQKGLFRGSETVTCGGVERRILELLLRQPGQVVPSEEIRRRLWASREVSENILNSYVTKLRTSLGDTRRSRGLHNYIRYEQHPEPGFLLFPSVRRYETDETEQRNQGLGWIERVRAWLPVYAAHAVAVSVLYGALLTVAFVAEVAYSLDRFAAVARIIAPFTFVWTVASCLLAFWIRSRRIVFGSESASFVGMIAWLSAALFGWFAVVRLYLPADSIVRFTEFQAYPAQAGLFKSGVWYSMPLLLVFSLLYHGALRLKSDVENEPVGAMRWRVYAWMAVDATLWLAIVGLAVGYVIPKTNHMIDVTDLGPYRNLFALLVLVRVGIWFAILVVSLLWFAGVLGRILTRISSPNPL